MKKYNWTDLGNAERFGDKYRGKLLHIRERKMWLERTDMRWEPISDDEIVKYAKAVVRQLQDDEADNRNASTFLRNIESTQSILNMIRLSKAEQDISVSITEFDKNPWELNVLNGVVDLKRGTLIPHSPDQKFTKIANVRYNPNARPEKWLRFLIGITCGDQKLVDFVQKAIGYSLTGTTIEQCLFILFGSGENGKSTFIEILRAVIGDYGLATPSSTLMSKRTSSIPNDIARLKGARIVTTVETGEDKKFDEPIVKQLTGSDTIPARFLREEFFEFRSTWKIYLSTNHRPVIKGSDRAIWRRIKLIPFLAVFSKSNRDKYIYDKLTTDEEKEAILAWAVEGCLRWQSEGLESTPEMEMAVRSYQRDMNRFGTFVSDKCYTHVEARTTMSDLYDAYKIWCSENDDPSLTKIAFNKKLTYQYPTVSKSKSGTTRFWRGIGLKKIISLSHIDDELEETK